MIERLITVAETLPFLRQADSLWGEDERNAFVDFIAANPETGEVIPGTGFDRGNQTGAPKEIGQ
jgi:hypothetical protein